MVGAVPRRAGTRPLVRVAMATMLATLPGCVVRGSTAAPLPPAPGELDIAMSEYRFEFAPPAAQGRFVVRVVNRGVLDHSLTLVALPEDYPPLDQQLHGDTRRGATTIATLAGRGPGATGVFAADLPPGRYGLVCFVSDTDGVLHALKGMNAEFRVS